MLIEKIVRYVSDGLELFPAGNRQYDKGHRGGH